MAALGHARPAAGGEPAVLSDPRPAPHGAGSPLASLPKAKIVARKEFANDLFVIWLQPEVPFSFKAGQYITIGAQGLERPYSIASAPFEPGIELFIEYILPEHGGKLTPTLWTLRPGDLVSMRPKAKGLFTFEPSYRDHVMVATVTGVAPFISMVRQCLHDGPSGHRFFVLLGASHQDELVYDWELCPLADQHPDWFKFVPTVSRPQAERNATWRGRTGRVNTLVEEYLEAWGLRPQQTLVYACGNPGMIEDVKGRLVPKGWRVKEERFWKED